ncbi:Protein of unknown function [Amycolatopsis arida]|uniref:DUF3558 domain-containing protein n=2 Tax=Amycolatopsis arida TaxID=587909 RepID=A0A1I5LNX3_9PSEU|nr:uncharacterized protein DUF3558 [Amycolatopsis arida]SFO98912.1 Protein of unknown function [Amycolatopsis arida]
MVVAVIAVALVGGCSPGEAGSPSPAELSTTSGSNGPDTSDPPHSGAPKVTNPLPESVLSGSPCDALTRQQVEDALGKNAGHGELDADFAPGPTCRWSNLETGAGFSVFFGTKTRQGLSDFYQNTRPQMKVWREIPSVRGYPAVAFRFDADPESSCTVAVGIADTYDVSVAVSTPIRRRPDSDPCVPAERLAGELVGNLEQKAGR